MLSLFGNFLKKRKIHLPLYEKARRNYSGLLPQETKKKKGVGLSTLKMRLSVKTTNKIIEIQVVPIKNNKYKINIVYDYKQEKLKVDNNQYCGIDLGINNLMTVTSNKRGCKPLVINGKPLKSINQYYNKTKAKYQSELPKGVNSSKKIDNLTFKRNNKINDYLHKTTNKIMKFSLENELNTIVVGYNDFWKQKINIGKVNNQNFVQIPFEKMLFMLKYKCEKYGINLTTHEESYTSKCSFLDNEVICKHDEYQGKRIKRGLFKSGSGKLINADVNGSYNIIRKVFPKAFANGIEGVAVHPYRVNL